MKTILSIFVLSVFLSCNSSEEKEAKQLAGGLVINWDLENVTHIIID